MKKTTLQAIVVSASILSAILVYSIVEFNWYGSSIHFAAIAEGKKGTSSSTPTGKAQTLGSSAAASSSSNTIQLSAKEESAGVYRWISSSNGAINPTLKVSPNTNNIIKIQNPTDTK